MNRKQFRFLALVLSLVLILGMTITAQAEEKEETVAGKLVILHTNDTHGRDTAVAGESLGTAAAAWLKKDYAAKGADVLLISAGDATQGKPLVNVSQGKTAIEFMNLAGYNLMTVGNHEFDYSFNALRQLREAADFPLLAANIHNKDTGELIFTPNQVIEMPQGYKVGVFGLDTPEALTKASPKNVAGLTFDAGEKLYACAQAQVDQLKAQGCDLIIAVGHLGTDPASAPNRSIDVIEHVTGIDLFIDGHSHTEIPGGQQIGNTLLVSTGEYLNNIGKVVYDGATLTADLISAKDYKGGYDEEVATLTDAYNIILDAEYGQVFAKTEVSLNGTREGGNAVDEAGNVLASFPEGQGNRVCETNLGDFAADAILEAARTSGQKVDLAITNGGGIRETIAAGDITKNNMITVFPFGNTVSLVTVTGSQLLEALEAACSSCPESLGAFPQVAGITFTIDTSVPYVNGPQYPDSTYYAPAFPGTRVRDVMIDGKPLDLQASYTVATNDFVAIGGDTYYAFKAPYEKNGIDTGIYLEDALIDYITVNLNGVIGQDYAMPKARILITGTPVQTALEPAA